MTNNQHILKNVKIRRKLKEKKDCSTKGGKVSLFWTEEKMTEL